MKTKKNKGKNFFFHWLAWFTTHKRHVQSRFTSRTCTSNFPTCGLFSFYFSFARRIFHPHQNAAIRYIHTYIQRYTPKSKETKRGTKKFSLHRVEKIPSEFHGKRPIVDVTTAPEQTFSILLGSLYTYNCSPPVSPQLLLLSGITPDIALEGSTYVQFIINFIFKFKYKFFMCTQQFSWYRNNSSHNVSQYIQ